jgi:hypothetical protein
MKCLVPIPNELAGSLKKAKETGIGYQVVSVELIDGRRFEQVLTSEGCVIEVRGHREIPFGPKDVASVRVTQKRWNYRGWSDARMNNWDAVP